MKKYIKNLVIYIVCLVVCVGLLGGCKGYCKEESKPIKIPADIKPIDTENYNDVYTVYWNYFDKNATYDTVLVCGYVIVYGTDKSGNLLWYPTLTDDSIKTIDYKGMNISRLELSWNDSISNQVESAINASIPNKCYIKGIVESRIAYTGKCDFRGHNIPILRITNVEEKIIDYEKTY
jgi:hypothetical protein